VSHNPTPGRVAAATGSKSAPCTPGRKAVAVWDCASPAAIPRPGRAWQQGLYDLPQLVRDKFLNQGLHEPESSQTDPRERNGVSEASGSCRVPASRRRRCYVSAQWHIQPGPARTAGGRRARQRELWAGHGQDTARCHPAINSPRILNSYAACGVEEHGCWRIAGRAGQRTSQRHHPTGLGRCGVGLAGTRYSAHAMPLLRR
jgi:hypothetical protein